MPFTIKSDQNVLGRVTKLRKFSPISFNAMNSKEDSLLKANSSAQQVYAQLSKFCAIRYFKTRTLLFVYRRQLIVGTKLVPGPYSQRPEMDNNAMLLSQISS